MRIFIASCLIFFTLTNLKAQDSTGLFKNWGRYLNHELSLGYVSSPNEDSLRTTYRAIEVGIWRSNFINYQHPTSSSLYFSQEFGVSNKHFIHGSKLGAQVTAMLFLFGIEVTHHTDFRRHSFAVSPYFGYGGYRFKISVGWRGHLNNENFRPLSNFNIGITLGLFQLSSKKKEGLWH